MAEFLTLTTPREALQIMLDKLDVKGNTEWIVLRDALNRVTSMDIYAPHSLPLFRRSTVDGYAVRAVDTYGASEALPVYLNMVGEVLMGKPANLIIDQSECALIHTGGMLPEAADAVVMLEYSQEVRMGEIEIFKATASGENVINIGEDVEEGQLIIPAGHWLRPAEIGGLAAMGVTRVAVTHKPRVAILSSGDEVVPLEADILPGQVRDTNTHSLSALIDLWGGEAINYGILPDRLEILEETARQALNECDMVVFTAGSSASARDLTSRVINRLGKPGVLVHGVNVRPGKPTILAVCDHKAVIGLPGNPVSALVIATLFLEPVLYHWLGLETHPLRPTIKAKLMVNLVSQAGREEWIPVRLIYGQDSYLAEPIFGKSNLIFTLVRADGMFRIPPEATGLSAGELIEVVLL